MASPDDRYSLLWERYVEAQEEARRTAEANALLEVENRLLREELARERAELRDIVVAALSHELVGLPETEVTEPAPGADAEQPTFRERLAQREQERRAREQAERERQEILDAARLEAEARRRDVLARRREETYGSPEPGDFRTAVPRSRRGARHRRRR